MYDKWNFKPQISSIFHFDWVSDGRMAHVLGVNHRYRYRVLQTIQMKLLVLCVWAEPAVLGSTKIVLKFKYEI